MKKDVILVTGGAGFIGSHLVEKLVNEKCIVIVIDRQIDKKSYFKLEKINKKCLFIKADITNKKKLEQIVKEHKISFIFHLAATTIVSEAFDNPYRTFLDNIIGTINLLEIVRSNKKINGMIFASSDKAYGKTKNTYTESSPLKGDHPYDVSKSSADLIAQTYVVSYNSPIVIARFGNVYGEGDPHLNRIIPGICEALIRRKTLQIRSNGKFIRDYVYVKDVVDGYIFLFNNFKKVKGQVFNFSSSDSYAVLDLLKKVEKTLKTNIPYKIVNNAKNEIPYQHLDDTKIRKLGWSSQYRIEDTIDNIVVWYKKVLKINT
jgi:CDP-glucose 4,6-dehydratase